VIITRAPTLEEIFQSNHDCVFSSPGWSKQLGKKIIELLADNKRREAIAFAGYNKVLENFTVARMAAFWTRLLEAK